MFYILIIIQTSLPFITLFCGVVPNIVLVAVAAVGFFDSEYAGAISGIAAGFMLDALGGSQLALMPLAGFFAGYFCGRAACRLLPRAPVPFLLCAAGVSAANLLLTVVCAYATFPEVRPGMFILHTLIPELFFTFILGIPAALLARACAKFAGRTGRDRA